MNIVYDGQVLRWQRVGGISRYFGELIARLPNDWIPSVLGLADRGHLMLRHPRLQTSTVRCVRPQLARTHWWRFRYARRAHVLHPSSTELTAGLSYADFTCPVVLTVYDLICARYAPLVPNSDLIMRHLRHSVSKAAHVICISYSTERDLLETCPAARGKTSVIHLASSLTASDSGPATNVLEEPTFLFVGARAGYKNYDLLIRAFAKASEVNPRLRLRVVGLPQTSEEAWQAHFLGITERVEYYVLPSDDVLRSLYSTATALLYPSCYEGFGIPVLEAMACGTVTVTSNTTSLPEVVGDAGIMLDPRDECAWTECILQLAAGGGDRMRLLEKGRQRVTQFSWDRTADKHVEIYKRLAS